MQEFLETHKVSIFVAVCACIGAVIVVVPFGMLMRKMHATYSPLDGVQVPVNWDRSYVESVKD